jgi:hypothetical protein
LTRNPELFRQIYSRTMRGVLMERRRARAFALVAALLAALAWGLAPGSSASAAGAATPLAGTFRITPGTCSGGASGSYFRMILPTGGQSGPFIENADSTCPDHTYTLLTPGTDGGLTVGAYQPAPSPGFDGKGNSLAVKVLHPVRFFGVDFSASTNPTDLQTNGAVPAPTAQVDGGRLTADLRAFDATWNKQSFNQGAPKPDGSKPGNTVSATGTYDAGTGAFTLTWASQIVGGPFNNFTGQWHLVGRFVPSAPGGVVAPATGSGSASTTVAAGAPADAGRDDGQVAAAPGGQAAPGAPSAPTASGAKATADRVHVADDGFQAPTWLVLALAGLGIAGVICLLVLGRRDDGRSDPIAVEGTPS